MNSKLFLLQNRIKELEQLAQEIEILSKKLLDLEDIKIIQPALSIKGQQRYRWARELLIQNNFSGIEEFERCYDGYLPEHKWERVRSRCFEYFENFIQYWTNEYHYKTRTNKPENERKEYYSLFMQHFNKSRSLLLASIEEVISRELPIITQLSFDVASNEFDTADKILQENGKEEIFIRVSGIICRVALERHLMTVIDSRWLKIIMNPPTKKKPESSDYIETLHKNWVITAIQKSKLEHLFKIWNNCAHPKESVNYKDVQGMINDSKDICSFIL